MAYVPIDPAGVYPGLRGNATAYQTLWGNHNEVYENTEPPIFDVLFGESLPDSLTDSLIFTWRLRGNRDLMPVVLRVYAVTTPTTSVLTFRVGGSSTTANVTGAAAWYTMSITPLVAGPVVCSLSITTPAAEDLTITRMQCRLNASSPAASARPSGYVRGDSVTIYAADEPVASEHVSRLLRGPICVARDRPACVALHLVRATAPTTAKSVRNWHVYDTANAETVGRLRVPRCATQARRYILDAYTLESAGGGTAEVTIGGIELSLASLGGTGGAWHEFELHLAPGPHDIRVAIAPGTGNAARMSTFQIWRAGSY